MSVILFTPEEIAVTARHYEATYPGIRPYGPEPKEVNLALQAFHYANHMAYCLTYGDWAVDKATGAGHLTNLEGVVKSTPKVLGVTRLTMKRLARELRSYLYNAISNAGTECLPEPHRTVLESAARAIVDRLAGMDDDGPTLRTAAHSLNGGGTDEDTLE
jgi:hypothetical protein